MAYRLVAQIGSRQIREPLAPGTYALGSGSQADITLREPTVSRAHATLEVGPHALVLCDLASRNGTFVGNKRTDKAEITPADTIRLGELVVRIEVLHPGDLEAAIPGAPEGSGPARAPSVATLATEFKQRFAARLPSLLAELANPNSSRPIAISLSRALSECEPGFAIEIAKGNAVLASVERPHGAHCESDERGEFSLTIRHHDPQAKSSVRAILKTGLDLLVLEEATRTPHVYEVGTALPEPASKPEPETLFRPLADIYDQAERVASAAINVLITGETGTGKELLANYLHNASGLPKDKFVALNCAALPADLLEAELFGIEAKVATGVGARAGKFELANGGTLFLDEIGDMSLATQAKLLRVLQEQLVYRVGGQHPYPAVVKVISATNQVIEQQIETQAFRRDLYHRIADWTVGLPTLVERAIDIPNLASYFLQQECGKAGIRFGGISRAAMSCLQQYSWPGNVRELEREMNRAAVFLNDGEMLDSERLQDRFRLDADLESLGGLQLVVEAAEKQAIESALGQSNGNVDQAAKFLGVGKSTLYRRMKHLGLG